MQDSLIEKVNFVLSKNPNINSYCEPFCGGLGSFLCVKDVLFDNNIKKVILNDINKNVINFYQDVKHNPYHLIQKYFSLEAEFFSKIPNNWKDIKKDATKEEQKALLGEANIFYKDMRDRFNTYPAGVDKSSLLLFLQKHCFNGIYRENKSGGHNVPFNWNGDFVNKEETQNRIIELSGLLNEFDIQLTSTSFEDIEYSEDTLYYLDPPYINDGGGENKYIKDGFNIDRQKELIENISHVPFIYSNHNSQQLIKIFHSFNIKLDSIDVVSRKNIVSASKEGRKVDKSEILITKLY